MQNIFEQIQCLNDLRIQSLGPPICINPGFRLQHARLPETNHMITKYSRLFTGMLIDFGQRTMSGHLWRPSRLPPGHSWEVVKTYNSWFSWICCSDHVVGIRFFLCKPILFQGFLLYVQLNKSENMTSFVCKVQSQLAFIILMLSALMSRWIPKSRRTHLKGMRKFW